MCLCHHNNDGRAPHPGFPAAWGDGAARRSGHQAQGRGRPARLRAGVRPREASSAFRTRGRRQRPPPAAPAPKRTRPLTLCTLEGFSPPPRAGLSRHRLPAVVVAVFGDGRRVSAAIPLSYSRNRDDVGYEESLSLSGDVPTGQVPRKVLVMSPNATLLCCKRGPSGTQDTAVPRCHPRGEPGPCDRWELGGDRHV